VSGLNQDRFGSATRESPNGATFGLGGETLLESLSLVKPMDKQFSSDPAREVRVEFPFTSPSCGRCRNSAV